MAHYLIFIPGSNGVNAEPHLKRVGLGRLLRDGERGPSVMEIDRGPDGKRGMLLTWCRGDKNDPKFMMHDRLEWSPAVSITDPELGELPSERFWVGVDKNAPPQPSDLIRDKPIAGASVMLNDGYSWLVPTISTLPNQYRLIDGGEISRVVKDQYAEFYDAGMGVMASILDHYELIESQRGKIKDIEKYSIEVTVKDGLKLITSALALNYRVTWEIAFMLNLLDDRSSAAALSVFCELEQIHESVESKKKLPPLTIPAGSYSSNGKMA